jgi:hypothetical protein
MSRLENLCLVLVFILCILGALVLDFSNVNLQGETNIVSNLGESSALGGEQQAHYFNPTKPTEIKSYFVRR